MKHHNLSEEERKKLLDPFPVESAIEPTFNNSLPYEELDGLRFGRLCYEILCNDGKNPRYNGNSGQQDYGVDIVTEHQDTITVYQCKNIKDRQSLKETVNDIKRAYSKVVKRWVGEQELPVTQFVYYSRQKLASIKKSKEYTHWRYLAFKKYGIDIQLWGRGSLLLLPWGQGSDRFISRSCKGCGLSIGPGYAPASRLRIVGRNHSIPIGPMSSVPSQVP